MPRGGRPLVIGEEDAGLAELRDRGFRTLGEDLVLRDERPVDVGEKEAYGRGGHVAPSVCGWVEPT